MAGKSALTAVQEAVMELVGKDSGLTALATGGVWDYVPDDPPMPYVCLDAIEETPDDTYSKQGYRVRLTFTIVSAYQGRAEQFAIVDALIGIVRQARFTVTSPPLLADWSHIVTWHVGSQAISPFEVGNTRAGGSQVTFEVHVVESTP